jgi:hypothetical protein
MIIKKEMVMRKLGADTILIPMGDALKEHNGLFMLSETACFLWEQLPTCDSVEELANKLYDEYDVTKEQAISDTQEFVDMLVKLDIIDK